MDKNIKYWTGVALLAAWLAVAATILLIRIAATPAVAHDYTLPAAPAVADEQAARVAREVAVMIAAYRAPNGVGKLTEVPALDAAAARKAARLASLGYFAHVRADGSASSVEFTRAAGYRPYDYLLIGENLACGFGSARQIMDAWIASEGHRKNLLEPVFTEYGVGYARGNVRFGSCNNKDDLIIVVIFGGVTR